ncbi:hypothetical protein RUM43_012629 [Polyplax serrata]|uniref:Uncharacterized protein n=1 Tax=Polyplax serrata TaxID=468196 RepID=A0AAN8Q300_POLSC
MEAFVRPDDDDNHDDDDDYDVKVAVTITMVVWMIVMSSSSPKHLTSADEMQLRQGLSRRKEEEEGATSQVHPKSTSHSNEVGKKF